MGAFDELFTTETQKSVSGGNIIAPKKSSMYGQNQQIQPSNDLTLDEILSGIQPSFKEDKTWGQAFQQGFQNLGASAKQQLHGLKEAVTHPIDTAAEIGQQIIGTLAPAIPGPLSWQKPFDPQIEKANELRRSYYDKFGTTEGLKESIAQDPIGTVINLAPVGMPVLSKAASLAKGATKILPKVYIEKAPSTFQSGGAAATQLANEFAAELHNARPEVQQAFAQHGPEAVNQENLNVLRVHNKFAEVDPDYIPTEGQAEQNIAKLSDEYNNKAKEGYEDVRSKFEQRDPFLIKGFNNVKENFAPEHSGVKQQGKANNILEEVKTNFVDADTKAIKDAYKALQDENGKFPVDMGAAAKNAFAKIEAEDRMDYLPSTIKNKLEKYVNGAEGNLNLFEHLKSDIASEQRVANRKGDGTTSHVLGLVRDSLEELPMTEENAIKFKEKADLARNLFKKQKDLLNPEKPTYNKLYAIASEDNRTPTERLTLHHPAAGNFFDNFVFNKKTSPADLSRAIDMVGRDSPAHQEMIAGLVDHLKHKSGIIDDKGNVSQAALNKELNALGPKLDLIAGPEAAHKLRNIGDVAQLSEWVRNKGGGTANVSQSAIVAAKEAEQQAKKNAALGVLEAGANIATKGASGAVSSVLKPIFKAKQERKAAEAAEAAKKKRVSEIVSPTAGFKLSDIGKE